MPDLDGITPSHSADLRVMSEVDRLAEAGRALDALDLLENAENDMPCRTYEMRLVELRHEAFGALADNVSAPVWPASYPDPFPNLDGGPPEIAMQELTPDLLGGALHHHGSLLVRGLIRSDQARELLQGVLQAFDSRDRADARADSQPEITAEPSPIPHAEEAFAQFGPGADRANAFGRRAFVRTVDAPGPMQSLLRLYREAGLDEALHDYLGERPTTSANKCVFRWVPPDPEGGDRDPSAVATGPATDANVLPESPIGGADYHQDGAFLGEGIRVVNAWMALTPCGVKAASLDLLPCRTPEILPTGGQGATFDWTLSAAAVDNLAGETPLVRPVFEPGDALLFDELLVHRTARGPAMSMDRYNTESWFFAPSLLTDRHVPIVF